MNNHLLKNRSFTLLMLGKLVSLMGTRMQNFALSLYVLEQTGSSVQFASLLALGLLPELFLGPFVGVIVDWANKRKLIVRLDLLSGLVTLSCAALFIKQGQLHLYQIYGFTMIFSFINTLFNPAISTMPPLTVPKEDIFDAHSINTIIMSMGYFIGPILGGFIYSHLSMLAILIINGLSFLMSALSEHFITYVHKPIQKTGKVLTQFQNDFTSGLRFVMQHGLILTLIILCFSINFFLYPVMSLGVVYIPKTILNASNEMVGLLQGSMTIGMLISPFFAKWFQKKFTMPQLIVLGEIGMGSFIALMGITPFLGNLNSAYANHIAILYFALMAFMVLFLLSIVNIGISSTIQSYVPKHYLGRVSTINHSISVGAMPLGQWLFGFALKYLPVPLCLSFNGIMIVALAAMLSPRLSSSFSHEPIPTEA